MPFVIFTATVFSMYYNNIEADGNQPRFILDPLEAKV